MSIMFITFLPSNAKDVRGELFQFLRKKKLGYFTNFINISLFILEIMHNFPF